MMTTLNDALVLPADVKLIPVEAYPKQTRSQFKYEPGDVAITRMRSRTPTKVINADLALLLEQFATEKTIVEAILYHSLGESLDPRELLDEAFPFILQLLGEKLLIPAGAETEETSVQLQRDDSVGDFTIVRPLQSLLDTELYQVRDQAGAVAALKLAKPSESTHIAFILAHEAEVLQYLDGAVSPRFIAQGTFDEQPYLVIEWCSGINAASAAADMRRSDKPGIRYEILDLCISILSAYAALHAQQVVHGDIHPGNILVDIDEKVRLIDFGLARVLDESASFHEPYPGGVAFFATPESSKAALEKQRLPRANYLGEQYALAALLYHMFTGAHYLDFSLEEEVMRRQIANDAPLPFSHHHVADWPEVEAVLGKALSKDPGDRFDSVADMIEALKPIAARRRTADTTRIELPVVASNGADQLVTEVLERVGWQSSLLADGLIRPPTASINYGAAGVGYFLYRVACTRNDPEALALADIWATRAEQLALDEDGFQNEEFDITPETVHTISPLHSPTGLYILRFLLAEAVGDEATQARALTAFVQAAGDECDDLDLTLGKSSVLLHSAYLYQLLPDQKWAVDSGLLALGNSLLEEIWNEVDGYAAVRYSDDLSNLGIAHGWAGILFATLRWCTITGTDFPEALETRLHQLSACIEYVGRGAEMPWDLNMPTAGYMPGWCNGSTGHLFLWTTAYRVFEDAAYLDLAIRSAWNVWEAPRSGVNLCCGLAGRAYALLNLHRLTGDDAWFDRARELARQAAVNARRPQTGDFEGFDNSLYKGDVGVAALLVDLEDPARAAMPFFESPRGH